MIVILQITAAPAAGQTIVVAVPTTELFKG